MFNKKKGILLNSLFADEKLKWWEPKAACEEAAVPKERSSSKSEAGLGSEARSFSNSQPSCSHHFIKQAQLCDHAVVSVALKGGRTEDAESI